ncbi:MAG: peptide ABC transporter substrate-binding protein [Rhodospirillaceae bacterium]|nr:peptide ABC transporter substrate-binding protein [Rhodospirillaceae bacterium]
MTLNSFCKTLIASAAAFVVFAGLHDAEATQVLRRGTVNEPRTLDPHYVQGNAGAAIMYDMFESLIGVGAKGEPEPGMAESWSISPDGKLYTFNLRPNLKWSDGKALTAEDFVYSFRRAVNPKDAARAARVMFPIKNARAIVTGDMPTDALAVKAVTPLKLTVELERPTPYFNELMISFSAAPVPRHVIEKYGDAWTSPANMVTNGAYKLAEFANNTHIKLVKNPLHYAADKTAIDEVYFYPIEKPETALTRFRAGEIDIAYNVPSNRLDWVKENLAVEFKSSPVNGVYYILLNNSKPELSDVRVRKALSLAVDRELITKGLIKTSDTPAYGIVPMAMPGYGDNSPAYANEPIAQRREEAKRLLAEAGYGPSKPLKINYKTGGQEVNRRIAVAIQSLWKQIGVEVEVENVGSSSIVADSNSGNFTAMRYSYFAAFEDAVSFLKLLETGGTINFSRYSNPKFDKMLDEADQILDPAKRLVLLREAEQLAMADFPVIPVYFNYRYYLVSQRVQGWTDNLRGEHLARFLSMKN